MKYSDYKYSFNNPFCIQAITEMVFDATSICRANLEIIYHNMENNNYTYKEAVEHTVARAFVDSYILLYNRAFAKIISRYNRRHHNE